MGLTRLDQSTKDDWLRGMARHESEGPSNSDGVLALIRSSKDYPTFDIDNLTHLLQTATRAERAGAGEELVLAALLHDVTAPFALYNHAGTAAELISPHVAPEVATIVRTHQEFQGRYYFQHFGGDTEAHRKYDQEPWYETAMVFSDEWDQCSFDPSYPVLPLEHFEPLIRQYCDNAWGASQGTS